MRTVRVLSRDTALAARLRRLLDGSLELRAGATLAQALEPTAGQADVLLVDFAAADVDPTSWPRRPARRAGRSWWGCCHPRPVPPGADRCDLAVTRDIPEPRSGSPSSRASARGGSSWRSPRSSDRPRREAMAAPPAPSGPGSPAALGTVLKEMGKLLAAHFDIERVVEFFLDAIAELVRPGRVALLLADEEGRFRPRGYRGLDPELAERLRLQSGEGLAEWFRQHVRPAVRDELEREPDWLDAAQELTLLGGEVAVPLWVQAKLVGILVLGPRVTGQPYGSEDLERLFTLASQVAMAVEDISLFNTVRAQHSFIEQVLAHLQSGAITIDAAGRVTRFNRRAEQILGLSVGDVSGRTPGPALAARRLLFETMRGGRELRLVEVGLPRSRPRWRSARRGSWAPRGPGGRGHGPGRPGAPPKAPP